MTAEIYRQAVDEIKKSLESRGISFLVYGSLLDDRLMPGISDIDGVIFFWDKFVIDRATIREVGDELRNRFAFLRFDTCWFLDISVVDAGNTADGRFIPYNDNFLKVFEEQTGDSKMICGQKFVRHIRPVRLVDPCEARLAYNLQSLRHYLLFGRCNYKWPNGLNPFKELKVFQQVRSLGRKILQLIEPNNFSAIKDKKVAYRVFKKYFQNVNFEALDAIEDIFTSRESAIDAINRGGTQEILLGALGVYEQVIRDIVGNFPMMSSR